MLDPAEKHAMREIGATTSPRGIRPGPGAKEAGQGKGPFSPAAKPLIPGEPHLARMYGIRTGHITTLSHPPRAGPEPMKEAFLKAPICLIRSRQSSWVAVLVRD